MIRNNLFLFVLIVIFTTTHNKAFALDSSFLVGTGSTTTALEGEAQPDETSTRKWSNNLISRRRVAGTYLVRGKADNFRIITLTSDGTWLAVASVQTSIPADPGIGFSDQQGVWKFTGHRKIIAKVLDFSYATADGLQTGNSVSIYKLTFSRNFKKLKGAYSGKTFPKDQNPLDPKDPNDFTRFEGIVEGMRVTGHN